jgi:hypothetical protein
MINFLPCIFTLGEEGSYKKGRRDISSTSRFLISNREVGNDETLKKSRLT